MANRRGRGGGGGTRASERAETAPPPEVRTHVVDLNSRSATHIASIVFLPVQQHNLDIIQFEVRDCLQVCQHFSHWLKTTGSPDIRDVLRIDDVELNLIAPNTKGNIFFLEGAATFEGNECTQVSIFALQSPKDKHVRYPWTPLSPSLLLTDLAIHDLIGPPIVSQNQFKPTFSPTGATLPPYHHTVYTIIVQCFEGATKYPDSPEMIKATLISDVCPSILDPATAHQRINATDELYASNDPNFNGKELSDDRYIHDLHPAERELASLLEVGCAEYLFIKRTYFKAFSRETVLHAAKVRRTAANTRNSNRAAGTVLVEVKEEDEEDEGEEGDADGDKENNIPAAVIPPASNPRATPATTRPRTRARQATDQQNVAQAAPDDKQKDEKPALDTLKSTAAPLTTRSHARSQRASNQQNVNQAAPPASTEQTDVTMKDKEDEDEKQSDQPPADTPNPRVTRSGVRTRQSTVNAVANPVATQNVKQAAPLASTEQNDVTMKDNEGDDEKKSEDPPADTLKPRVTRAGARTRQSAANPVATRSVNQTALLAGTEQMDVTMKDQEDEDNANDEPPAVNSKKRAATPAARGRGRPKRQKTVDLVATEDDSDSPAGSPHPTAAPAPRRGRGRPRGLTANLLTTNDDKNSPAGSPHPTAAPATAPRRGRGRPRASAANPFTRVVRVATPIDPEETEDDGEDKNESEATPAPTASPAPRATPAADTTTTSTVQAHAGRRRPQRTAAQLAASRSDAAAVGAINRATRVRTVNKHIRTMEEQTGFTYRRAYKWILGWDLLGFLDEERVLAVQEGEDNDEDEEWSE
jgi:hypothetical protein